MSINSVGVLVVKLESIKNPEEEANLWNNTDCFRYVLKKTRNYQNLAQSQLLLTLLHGDLSSYHWLDS